MRYLLLFLVMPFFTLAQSDAFTDGVAAFRAKQYTQAIRWFETELQQRPGNLSAIEYLGDSYGMQRNWNDALAAYKKLRALRPSVANYHYKYGGVLGMIAKESNKFKALSLIDDVRDAFVKAIELDPGHIEARWALVELYLQLPGIVGGSEKKAKRYAAELARLSPVDGYLAKAHIAEYFGRYAEAEQHYRSAINVGRSQLCYQKLADLYKHKMNLPEKAKSVMAEYHQRNKS